MKLAKLIGFVLLGATLVLTGCGGGGGSSTPSEVSGVVADGYLSGAVVFSDRNLNKILDIGEPNTLSGEGGAYTLVGTDVDKYPVVVVVNPGAGVRDSDYPDVDVAKSYVLSTPAGKPEFISPLTTLVQEQIRSNPALDVTDAEALVKEKLGVENIDLFTDYVAEEEVNADYQTVHKVAQVVTATFADMKSDIEMAAAEAGLDLDESLDAIVSMVVDQVMAQLQVISGTVAVFDPETVFDQAAVDSIVEQSVDQVDTSAVAEDIADKQIPVVKTAFQEILQAGGTYWLDIWSNPGEISGIDAEYGHVTGAADGSLAEEEYDWDNATETWVSTSGDSGNYILNASGEWVADSDGASNYTYAFNADGSATLTHKNTGATAKLSVAQVDLAGLPMSQFADDFEGYLAVPGAVFPAGAKAFNMTFVPQSDSYRIWRDDLNWQNYVGVWDETGKTAVGNFAEMLTAFSDTSGDYLGISQNLNVQFGNDNTLNLFEYNGQWPLSAIEGVTGTWGYKTISGVEMVVLDIPKTLWAEYDIDSYRIFVEWQDEVLGPIVKEGGYEPAGLPDSGGIDFNETAFNAILSNLTFGEADPVPPVETNPITTEMVSGQTFVVVDPQSANNFELISLESDGTLVLRGREWDEQLMQDVDYIEQGTWVLADGIVTGTVGGGSGTVELVTDAANVITVTFSEVGGQYSGLEIWAKTVPFVAADLIGNSYMLSEGQVMTFTGAGTATFTEFNQETQQLDTFPFTWSVDINGVLLADFTEMIRTIHLVAGGSAASFQIAGFGGEGEMFEVFMDTLSAVPN